MVSAPATPGGSYCQRDGHPDVVRTPAELGGDPGRGDGRTGPIGEGAFEVCADGSPSAPGRYGQFNSLAQSAWVRRRSRSSAAL